MDAKHFIPAFISSMLEFFADENYKDERPKENSAKENQALPHKKSSEDFHKFAVKIFEILIENAFDGYLLAEQTAEDPSILADLVHNIEIEDGTDFSKKTTRSKIFALFSHALSPRFEKSWASIFKVLELFLQKCVELGLRKSPEFNIWLAGLYKGQRAAFEAKQSRAVLLEGLLGSLLNFSDAEKLFCHLFKGIERDVEGLLADHEFRFFVHLIAERGKALSFALFSNHLRPAFLFLLNKNRSVTSQTMELETEQSDKKDDQKNFESKLERILFAQFVTALGKFTDFRNVSGHEFVDSLEFLLGILETETNVSIARSLVRLLTHLCARIANATGSQTKFVAVVESLRSHNALAKASKKLISASSPEEVELYESYLKVLGKVLPGKHTTGLIEKNTKRLRGLIEKTEAEARERAVKESAIVSALLTVFDELYRQPEVFAEALSFGQSLLKRGIKGGAKAGFKMLRAVFHNSHPSQYVEILNIVQESIENFLLEKRVDAKFELFALKFLRAGIESIALNFDHSFLIEHLKSFTERFLSFIVFNMKNRNSKARSCAKGLLSILAALSHSIDPSLISGMEGFQFGASKKRPIEPSMASACEKAIDENSLVIGCLIAGLAGESTLMKSASIEALAHLFKSLAQFCSPSLIKSSTEVVLLMIKEKNREILASVFKFLKVVFKTQEKEILKAQLPLIAEAIFDWDPTNSKAIRNKAKTLISVILRKFVG